MHVKPRVLFVDDEDNVLSGLKRMLRGQRAVWEMEFANSGAAALTKFAEHPFDVVVSDMRMPGMDGAELLNRIAEDYPQAVRLVLSGQSEHERIFRAIGPAHQFLSKPCEEQVLVRTIERACGIRTRLQNSAVQELVMRIGTLPSLPIIYRRLVEELESDNASIDRVGEIIESDLAMSAKVLQLTNSSFFGLPHHVTCPRHAVSMLGLSIVRPLGLTAGAFSQFEPKIPGFDLDQSIEHGLAVAVTARRIAEAEAHDAHLTDDAFIAGMLHDIGKLILATHLSKTFEECLLLAGHERIPLWQAELRIMGTTHAEVGAHLLELWGLPHPIVEAVALHHRPQEAAVQQFAPLTAVHVADFLLSDGLSGCLPNSTNELDKGYLHNLGLEARLEVWSQLAVPRAPRVSN